MTTAEMITAVRDLMGEDSVTATQVSTAQILSFLNARSLELCADSNALVSAWTTSTVNGQSDYSVPVEYVTIEKLILRSATKGYFVLNKVEIEDLDPVRGPGTPQQFAVWGANVSGDNSPIFILDPTPNFSGSSDLECWGRQYPKTLVSGGQGPEYRLREQWTVIYGAVASCFLRFAEGSPTCLGLADRYEAKWEAGKKQADYRIEVDVRSPRRAVDNMSYTSPGWR